MNLNEKLAEIFDGSSKWKLVEDERFVDRNIYDYKQMKLVYEGDIQEFKIISTRKLYNIMESFLPEDHDDIDRENLKFNIERTFEELKKKVEYHKRLYAAIKDKEDGKEFVVINTKLEFYGEHQMNREIDGEIQLAKSLIELNRTSMKKCKENFIKLFKLDSSSQ